MVAIAGLVRGTVRVIDTLSLSAANEGITEISGAAEAYGPVVSLTIRTRFTIGVRSAWIRVAKITLVEWAATVKWMSSVALGAGANGLVVLDAAFGIDAASARARVDALQIEASLVAAAILVLRALGEASREWITQEVGRARANCAMVSDVAVGVRSARSARIHAPEVGAGSVRVTFRVRFALSSTSLNWVAHPSIQARANCPAVLHATPGVGTAR